MLPDEREAVRRIRGWLAIRTLVPFSAWKDLDWAANSLNWDYEGSVQLLDWIASRSACRAETAFHIFWLGVRVGPFLSVAELAKYDHYELCAKIAARFRAGKYRWQNRRPQLPPWREDGAGFPEWQDIDELWLYPDQVIKNGLGRYEAAAPCY